MSRVRAEHRRPGRAAGSNSGVLDGSPEDISWLIGLIQHTPLLPEPALRAQWRQVLPWLDADARYSLAATLLAVERELAPRSPGSHESD